MDLGWMSDPVAAAERGENPTVLLHMPSGFAVIGLSQFLPGYCLLLASPKVDRLETLDRKARATFLNDMGLLGEAVAEACSPRRMNYSIYGNTDAYLHAHVVPRYDWEPPERIKRPIWEYPAEMWTEPSHLYNESKHGDLRARIADALTRIAKT
ncbi:MAG TPA: hypothetical protein VMD53_13725 [Rhizomicrobium sp.]|nr:hypothetical protein [Rhizomicrobium sp.]